MHLRLNRVLQHAVSYALLGSTAACGGQTLEATETNVTRPVAGPAGAPGDGSNAPGDGDTGGEPVPGGSGSDPGAERVTQLLPCLSEGESQFERMLLAREYDYVVLRTELFPGLSQAETQASGVACSGASDAPACLEQLAATWPLEDGPWRSCTQLCQGTAIVLTAGDDVERIDSPAGVQQLLGSIDTPYEAALLAQSHGFTAVCDATRFAPVEGGFTLVTRELVETCPITFEIFTLHVSTAGLVDVTQRVPDDSESGCIGRRPAGLCPLSPNTSEGDDGSVGHFFAKVARLEASAVHAFRIMAEELAALGAPRRLERAALRAARDEVRHAKVTSRLARRYGAEPRRPEVAPRSLRPLFELALENVVEGCVRETYGAACGRFQAARASDPSIRGELERVARDEARHAELSWRIHGWAQQRLSRHERQALAQAAHTAIAELRQELTRDPGHLVREVAGMPAPEQALALLDSLHAELWSASNLAAA